MKWEEKELDKIGVIGRGKSRHRPRNAEFLYGGDYPLIQTGDIQNANLYITTYKKTYSDAGLAQSKLWKKGTLCISIVGANTGETAILGLDACFPDSVIGFNAFEGYSDNLFIKYALEVIKRRLKSISEGTARENLSMAKLLSVKIPMPDFSTRKKIAGILSAYDDTIENNCCRIALLKEVAQNIYREWFVDFRFPDYEEAEFANGLPVGWKRKSFSDTAEFINGYAFKPKDFQPEGFPIIKIKELKNGVENDTPRNDGINVPPKYIIDNGTVIFSWSAHLDAYYWISGKGILNQHAFKVISKGEISNEFLFFSLKSQISGFRNRANGSTMKHIKRSALGEVYTLIPDKKVENEFVSLVSPILSQLITLKEHNQTLKEARDILLPRLMNGTIEV